MLVQYCPADQRYGTKCETIYWLHRSRVTFVDGPRAFARASARLGPAVIVPSLLTRIPADAYNNFEAYHDKFRMHININIVVVCGET